MQSEDGRRTAVAAWGAPGPSTGTFFVQPYMTTATIPQKRKPEVQDPTSESIDCICGLTHDDGSLSIACDDCERWCHAVCFDIVEGEVPEEWRCWVCLPRPVDKERAVRIQRERKKQIQGMIRRNSPGVEKKPRRASAAAIEGSRRRRRPSILTQTQTQTHTTTQPQQRAEDEHVEICDPWTVSYVPITKDIVPHRQTREKLERAAHNWRGVTALQVPEQDLHPPRTTIQPLPASSFSHPTLSLCTNPSVRPPSYAVHTAEPVPRSRMITPYHSTIIPSSAYLSDTLNAYAHLGMPKPFVHLIGPPLDLALDSRITGDSSRFLRSGCKPNAVLRPMLCPESFKKKKDTNDASGQEDGMLGFGVFALRDLKANEEVVLGWEWDDGHAVHNLPALIESPHIFKSHHVNHLRNQMTSMLNSFSSTFTTCACGAKANDCALNLMAAFVDGDLPPKPNLENIDLGPLVGSSRGFKTREKVPFSGGMTGVEMVPGSVPGINQTSDVNRDTQRRPNGRHTSPAKRSFSGPEASSEPLSPPRGNGRRGKKSVTIVEDWETDPNGSTSGSSSEQPRKQMRRRRATTTAVSVADGGLEEDKMPPKMRKRWIHQSSEALRTARSPGVVHDEGATDDEVMEVDSDSNRMPPPPLPLYRPPATGSTTPSSVFSSSVSPSGKDPEFAFSPPAQDISPSAHFANLSLLSPVVEQSNSFSLKESLSLNFSNQQTPSKLSHSSSFRNANEDILNPILPVIHPPSPPVVHKREEQISLNEPISPPSPLHTFSSIDGNMSRRESSSAVPLAHDSPQMLLSLPHYEENRQDGESNEGSHLSKLPSSQPPDTPQSPLMRSSPSERISSPSISIPQHDAHVESPTALQSSSAPQKVKTSFKDFLMRKKRQQEEHVDLPPSPNMNNPHTESWQTSMLNGSIHSESDTGEGEEKHVAHERLRLLESPSSRPDRSPPHEMNAVEDSTLGDSRSASLEDHTESSAMSKPSDSWILDPKVAACGLVVQIREEWHKRDMAGIQGVVKAVICREGMTPLAIIKPFRGTGVDGVPIVHIIPVPPSRIGDMMTVIEGKLKGETGSVVDIQEGRILIRLESSGSISEVKEDWMCRISTEGEMAHTDVVERSHSQPFEEDGEIVQATTPPQPTPSGVKQLYATSSTPTQPRSFLAYPTTSSSKPNPRPPPTPVPPSRPRQASPTQPSISRPPSGPKALRAGGPKSSYVQPHQTYPPKRSFGTNPSGGVSNAPKGPSADRDREREWTGSTWSSRSRPPPSGGWR